ncbi:MAG: 3,4-dihydroxy-2-butanone-4-phosphate synthase [Rhizobiales bacterium]|nr:3,4-dihydroxy-2-butanone-4-phosphate synthase [Hyphomicrobiales bacterium]
MFILVDAEDRENEGDLIVPGQMATPEAVNFMAKYGRGLVCLALTGERAEQLDLSMMSSANRSRHQTAFTISIEAREGISTGISAHDRARTISVAIDPTKSDEDLVSPGHVFPLIARDGGVLVRAGHTEAAVDISRLAGLHPSGVICEIMNDDGTMARLPDLVEFARHHELKIGTIADLIAYRRSHDSLVRMDYETKIDSPFGGKFDLKVYVNTLEYAEHIVLAKGEIRSDKPTLVRMHSVNVVDDIVGANVGTGNLIHRAMEEIEREGSGVIVVIRDTRPTTVTDRLLRAEKGDNEKVGGNRLIEYGVGAQILLDLGVKDMILMSNAPSKKIVGLEGYGLRVVGHRTLSPKDSS